jgi:FkbM family methyltransferase
MRHLPFPGRKYVRRWLARQLHMPEIPSALARLKAQGFVPKCVFDVGAYKGDFARDCLEVWPTSTVVCFEPQPQMQASLLRLGSGRAHVELHQVILGAKESTDVTLYCSETASSVLREHHSRHPELKCKQTTVDTIVKEHYSNQPPDLLKMDVQGYELEVLKGAQDSLVNVPVILLELNLLDLHQAVPLFADVIAWLNDREFVAFDVCGLIRRPLDQALWQTDMLFVKSNSEFRSDKRWSAGN